MQWRKGMPILSSKTILRLTLTTGFIFVLLIGVAIVSLHVAADRQLRGEAVLARLRANVSQLSVIEYHWRVNGGFVSGLDSRAGEGSGEVRLTRLIDGIRQDALSVQQLTGSGLKGGLIRITDAYIHSIERLRQLYLDKNTVQAFAYDDNNVDNAYTDLGRSLDAIAATLSRRSDAARSIATVGTLFALIIQFAILAYATKRLSNSREKGAALSAQQETLRLSERRLGVLIGNVDAVVSVIDRTGAFTYTSPQTEEIFGFVPSHIDEIAAFEKSTYSVSSVLEREEGETLIQLQLKDGPRDFLLQTRSLFEDPAVKGQVLVWHDVTLKNQAQKAIEEARDSAVRLSKLKSEFLANMSHEIRTPMNGVLGMVDLLLDTELTEIQADYTETVRSCGIALMSLLNDILDFSKLESGRLILEELPLDPAQVVEESADLVRAIAAKKGLELIVAVDDVDWIQADPTRLRQIILNLLSNAVKFTDAGEVVVKVEFLERNEDRAKVRFSVKDSGIGIPEAKLKDVFGAFVQVDGSTTRVYGGTGLGLSISEQLVNVMGGQLKVTSEVGKGSEFSFEIDAPIARPERGLSDTAALRGKSVLIVDDSHTNRNVLADLLTRWGCQIQQASNVEETKKSLAAHKADLIILDNLMPELDGVSLARQLQADGERTPIILLTSVGTPMDLADLRNLGIRQCLSKPARRRDLYQAMIQSMHSPSDSIASNKVEVVGGSMRVLVVEDNIVNQTVARKLLASLGCAVDLASGGFEALEMLNQNIYEVIFMDCLMPDMDGYETTRRLRGSEEYWKRTIPIIALTASAMEGDRQKCLACGMDDYVSKPVTRASLEKALQKWRTESAA